jgi:two-component system vancomycin resistance associated response regulator VraR
MPETHDTTSARGSPSEPRRKRVLFVEDDPIVLQSLAKTLVRERQYDVHTAHDGEEAIRFLAGTPCDVIVSDLTMPGLSGHRLVQALQKASRNASLIVVSANDSTTPDGLELSLPGVASYLVKPLRRKALLEAIASALSRIQGQPTAAC